jgi:hypothetical protein
MTSVEDQDVFDQVSLWHMGDTLLEATLPRLRNL